MFLSRQFSPIFVIFVPNFSSRKFAVKIISLRYSFAFFQTAKQMVEKFPEWRRVLGGADSEHFQRGDGLGANRPGTHRTLRLFRTDHA